MTCGLFVQLIVEITLVCVFHNHEWLRYDLLNAVFYKCMAIILFEASKSSISK